MFEEELLTLDLANEIVNQVYGESRKHETTSNVNIEGKEYFSPNDSMSEDSTRPVCVSTLALVSLVKLLLVSTDFDDQG